MPLLRPKHPLIYGTVWGWWTNLGGVSYIAHAVTKANVVRLGAVQEGTGGKPTNHPDQVFWRRAVNNPPAAATVLRIEIDCSLMPCDTGDDCCLYKVPQLIVGVGPGYDNMPLRIFSHRNEGMGPNELQNKRMFSCKSSDDKNALRAAYNQHQNWFWASLTDRRIGNSAYHLF